jgi:hypothetical protein
VDFAPSETVQSLFKDVLGPAISSQDNAEIIDALKSRDMRILEALQ